MKATEQYSAVVLLNMLCKVVLTFEPVGEILKCDHSTESCWALLSRGTVYYDVQRSSQFWVCEKKFYSVTIQMKSTKQYFPVVLFIMLYKVDNTHLPSTAERSDYNRSIPRPLILMSILSNLWSNNGV